MEQFYVFLFSWLDLLCGFKMILPRIFCHKMWLFLSCTDSYPHELMPCALKNHILIKILVTNGAILWLLVLMIRFNVCYCNDSVMNLFTQNKEAYNVTFSVMNRFKMTLQGNFFSKTLHCVWPLIIMNRFHLSF